MKKSKKLRRKTREEEDGLVSGGIVTYCVDDPLPYHPCYVDANR